MSKLSIFVFLNKYRFLILKNLGCRSCRFLFCEKFGVEFWFLKNLGCRSCRGHFTLTIFSQIFPKYHPPEKFLGTLRREAKKFIGTLRRHLLLKRPEILMYLAFAWGVSGRADAEACFFQAIVKFLTGN